MAVECVIECDDPTHLKNDRIKRDLEVGEALKTAGIPIKHISYHSSDTLMDLERKLGDSP
ncbi:DUF2726 domain-containing protein [Candidatus Saccharibacteria bacterium]|nr:DUF2726 domain-containing protein [Candidatus Saccharibacteria bacterium]